MRMTLIYDSLQGKASAWNRFAVEVLTVLGTGAMFYFAWIRMERSVSIQEAEIGLIAVPVWPTTIFMTVGLGIFMLQAIAKLISGTKAHLVQPAKEESQ